MSNVGVNEIGSYSHTPIFAGDFPVVSEAGTVLASQGVLYGDGSETKILFGSVVAKNTASGKLVAWDPSGTGGNEIPYGIISEDEKENDGADAQSTVYRSGEFNTNALLLKTGATMAQLRAALPSSNPQTNIYLFEAAKADGTF